MNLLKNYSNDRPSNKSYLQLQSFDLPGEEMKDNDNVLTTSSSESTGNKMQQLQELAKRAVSWPFSSTPDSETEEDDDDDPSSCRNPKKMLPVSRKPLSIQPNIHNPDVTGFPDMDFMPSVINETMIQEVIPGNEADNNEDDEIIRVTRTGYLPGKNCWTVRSDANNSNTNWLTNILTRKWLDKFVK